MTSGWASVLIAGLVMLGGIGMLILRAMYKAITAWVNLTLAVDSLSKQVTELKNKFKELEERLKNAV